MEEVGCCGEVLGNYFLLLNIEYRASSEQLHMCNVYKFLYEFHLSSCSPERTSCWTNMQNCRCTACVRLILLEYLHMLFLPLNMSSSFLFCWVELKCNFSVITVFCIFCFLTVWPLFTGKRSNHFWSESGFFNNTYFCGAFKFCCS